MKIDGHSKEFMMDLEPEGDFGLHVVASKEQKNKRSTPTPIRRIASPTDRERRFQVHGHRKKHEGDTGSHYECYDPLGKVSK